MMLMGVHQKQIHFFRFIFCRLEEARPNVLWYTQIKKKKGRALVLLQIRTSTTIY
jgi:hypothetical protein